MASVAAGLAPEDVLALGVDFDRKPAKPRSTGDGVLAGWTMLRCARAVPGVRVLPHAAATRCRHANPAGEPDEPKTRQLLHAVGGLAVLGLLATGLISPAQAQAASARPGFDARELNAALAALGAQEASASAELSLAAPDIAEVANAVSVEVKSRLPGTDRIAILVEKNPFPLAAVFSIPEGTQPEVITRLKMAQSADVVALVRANGRFHIARKAVIVTISGCG